MLSKMTHFPPSPCPAALVNLVHKTVTVEALGLVMESKGASASSVAVTVLAEPNLHRQALQIDILRIMVISV